MNHLMRELAPVTEDAWTQIDEEAARSIKHFVAARRLVDFEGPLELYRATRFVSPWRRRHDPDKFWHLVYEVPDGAAMRETVSLALERHAGVVHMTDGTLPNPWDRLPPYWDAELALVAGVALTRQGPERGIF